MHQVLFSFMKNKNATPKRVDSKVTWFGCMSGQIVFNLSQINGMGFVRKESTCDAYSRDTLWPVDRV